MIVIAVVVADIVAPKQKITLPPIETTKAAIVETTSAWEEPTTVWGLEITYYRVNGVGPEKDWQRYLYDRLEAHGIAWFYQTAICQIYQESNWNRWSDNGHDKGLCQFKEIYWADRCAAAGWPGSDIWDVYAQLHVYAWTMAGYLSQSGGNVEMALSMYYLGRMEYSGEYVGHVMRWLDYLKVVE